jgi:hypothetical protein
MIIHRKDAKHAKKNLRFLLRKTIALIAPLR